MQNELNPFCDIGAIPQSFIWDDKQSDEAASFLFNFNATYEIECKNRDITAEFLRK